MNSDDYALQIIEISTKGRGKGALLAQGIIFNEPLGIRIETDNIRFALRDARKLAAQRIEARLTLAPPEDRPALREALKLYEADAVEQLANHPDYETFGYEDEL